MIRLAVVILLAVSFMGCEKEDVELDATIIGRWKSVGFAETIRYDFTADKRFTMYADSLGDFPTLEEFQLANPNLPGNDWSYSGDTVVVDLNFGNFSRLYPNFKCDNEVIEWIQEDGTINGTFYREDHDISACN